MINYIRNMTALSQIVALNTIASGAIVLGYAWAASAQSITPQTKIDCDAIVCTVDGAVLPETVVTITPKATITQVCRVDGCSSSWVGHETDGDAIGVEPQAFVVEDSDRR